MKVLQPVVPKSNAATNIIELNSLNIYKIYIQLSNKNHYKGFSRKVSFTCLFYTHNLDKPIY